MRMLRRTQPDHDQYRRAAQAGPPAQQTGKLMRKPQRHDNMLISCAAYQDGRKLADIDIDAISDYVSKP
ncbi:hypothetical protein, partial [Serratia marcescens]|uniref:hypothetical protein n=1 Tax=Serratia marcescens TaxID=615 RepID=UPI001C3786AA